MTGISAADAADRVAQLITLTERLTERLSAELALFEKRRPHETVTSLPETASLANLYRHEAAKVKADPDLIRGAPTALVARLKRATEAFDSVLQRHSRVLEAAKTLTEGLVRAIATEVGRQRTPVSAYGATGRTKLGDMGAVTLNQRA